MSGSETTWMLLGHCLRMFLISFSGQMIGLCISGTLLKRRRNLVPLLIVLVGKFFLGVCVVQVLLAQKLSVFDWYEVLKITVSTCGAIFTVLLFYYTYYGSAVKCVFAMTISELLASVIMLPATMIVNFWQKREDLFLFLGEFQITDIFIPVIEFLIFFVFYYFAAPLMRSFRAYRFRNYQIRNNHIWLSVYVVGFSLIKGIDVLNIMNNRTFMISMYLVSLLTTVAGVIVFFAFYLNYRMKTILERAYLNTQIELLETHYQAIQSQVQQMESCQKMIAQQMKEIISEKEAGLSGENTKKYLENLKQEYQKLRAGMYCNDWRVDAVLYCQIETARTYGIDVEYQIQGFDGKCMDQQTFSQLLFLLMHNGIKEMQRTDVTDDDANSPQNEVEKKIQLRTGNVAGKFIISFWISEGKMEQILDRQIRKLVKENGGTVTGEADRNGVTVLAEMK